MRESIERGIVRALWLADAQEHVAVAHAHLRVERPAELEGAEVGRLGRGAVARSGVALG